MVQASKPPVVKSPPLGMPVWMRWVENFVAAVVRETSSKVAVRATELAQQVFIKRQDKILGHFGFAQDIPVSGLPSTQTFLCQGQDSYGIGLNLGWSSWVEWFTTNNPAAPTVHFGVVADRFEASTAFGFFQNLQSYGTIFLQGMATTASAANVRWDITTSGLQIVSSLERVKKNITSITDEQANALMKVRPVIFQQAGDPNPKFPDYDPWNAGVIAEEIAAIPELPFLTEVDPDGTLSGVTYDRFVMPLIRKVQMQQDEINELRARLDKAGI